jgi:hypothetical protein
MIERRKSVRMLSDEDIDAIANRLVEFSGLTNEEHKEQHEVFKLYMQERIERREFWNKIRQQVGGWTIIAMLGLIGSAVWHGTIWAIGNIRH